MFLLSHLPCQRVVLVLAALALVGHTAVGQQGVRGTVLELGSNRPVDAAQVRMLAVGGKQAGFPTRTDSAGEFTIVLPTPGRYALEVKRIGFEPATTQLYDVGSKEMVVVETRLSPTPQQVAPLTIVERAKVDVNDPMFGVDERRRLGFGHFLMHDQIAAHASSKFSTLFLGMPGVVVNGDTLFMRAGDCPRPLFGHGGDPGCDPLSGLCNPTILVDHSPMSSLVSSSNGVNVLSLDDFMPNGIEAIEVYATAAEIPGALVNFRDSCGLIAVWLKH